MSLTTTREPPIDADLHADVAPNDPNTLRDRFDPVDLSWQRWFPSGLDASAVAGNEVIGYIRGETLFKDMASAINSARSSAHFLLIAGWSSSTAFSFAADPDGNADPSGVITDLLTQATAPFVTSAPGAFIRALYFKHPGNDFGGQFDNGPMVDFINTLPHSKAVHDSRLLTFGSHHHKLLIVNGEEGLVAFVGGNDMLMDRYVIHDTHVRIRGPAAVQLYSVFMERWNEHPETAGVPALPPPIPSAGTPPTNHLVQIARTYPNGSAHPGIVEQNKKPKGYGFASTGKREIEALTLHAIDQAEHFIYLEDQYLVSMTISNALAARLPKLAYVLVLICTTANVNAELRDPVDVAQYWRRRRDFLDPLFAVDKTKVHVFEYRPAWMHSKTWVFDDKFALVGSANVNRRGYTHDSEVTAGIFDTNPKGGVSKQWFFAHELRMNLWAKHLAVAPSACRDPIAGLTLWTAKGVKDVSPYDRNADSGTTVPEKFKDSSGISWIVDTAWDQGIDPDGS